MGTFSVYISLGSVPSLFFSDSFILYSLRQESREIIIKRKMKLLFQLSMTFLALVCLAIAIPAPQGHGHSSHGHHSHGDREKDSVEEPNGIWRMAIPPKGTTRPPHPRPRPPYVMGPRGKMAKEKNLDRMAEKKMEK